MVKWKFERGLFGFDSFECNLVVLFRKLNPYEVPVQFQADDSRCARPNERVKYYISGFSEESNEPRGKHDGKSRTMVLV